MHALTTLTEEESLFQEEISRFAYETITPHVEKMDEEEKLEPTIRDACFEMGLMGIEVPDQYGGSGGSFFMSILAIEAISKVDPAVGVFVDVQNTLVNNIFMNWANDTQKATYFPQLCQSSVGAFCLTEANSGSDAFALASRAEAKGEKWILNGKKVFITNAAEASLFVVFANINPELGYKGITAFLVEKGAAGLELGKKEKKLGIRASSTCEVILNNVEVDTENILGEVGKGYKIAIETLNEGRIGIAAQMLGLAQGAFEGARKYAQERSQFGKTLDQFQSIQFQLSEMATKLEAARLLVYNAARLKCNQQKFVKEAAMAKFMVTQLAEEIASLSLEIYGGYGFIKEYPAEKFYRDVKIGKLYEGTSNLQLQTIFRHI